MEQLKTYVTNFVNNNMIPLAVTAILVGLVLAGLAFMGTQKMKEWAKGHILYIIGGAAVVYTATAWAADIAKSFGF